MNKKQIILSGDKFSAIATFEGKTIMSLTYCNIQMDWCFQEYVPFFKPYCGFNDYEKGINPIEILKDRLIAELKDLAIIDDYEIVCN